MNYKYKEMQCSNGVMEKYPDRTRKRIHHYDSWDRSGFAHYYFTPQTEEELRFAKYYQMALRTNCHDYDSIPPRVIDAIPEDLWSKTTEGSRTPSKIAELSSPKYIGADTSFLNKILSYHDNVEKFFVHGEEVSIDEYSQELKKAEAIQAAVFEKRAAEAKEDLKGKEGLCIEPELYEDTRVSMKEAKGLKSGFLLIRMEKQVMTCRLHNGCFSHCKEEVEIPLHYIKSVKKSYRLR